MKKCLILICIVNILSTSTVRAQQPSGSVPETISALIAEISSAKGRVCTMKLRLKNIDGVMEKIWFYDRDNIDVVFDMHGWEKNPVLAKSMADAHPGLQYRVVFSPENIMSQGTLEGKLVSFEPVFLEKIK